MFRKHLQLCAHEWEDDLLHSCSGWVESWPGCSCCCCWRCWCVLQLQPHHSAADPYPETTDPLLARQLLVLCRLLVFPYSAIVQKQTKNQEEFRQVYFYLALTQKKYACLILRGHLYIYVPMRSKRDTKVSHHLCLIYYINFVTAHVYENMHRHNFHLQEEVDQVGVLFEFGTDYAEKLDLFTLCRSSQNLTTQTDQLLWKSENALKHLT